MQRSIQRELLAEFLGTLVLIVFGCGSVAQVLLSGKENGAYLSINIGWAFGVTLGVFVAGGVSGAHLNPAVTLALAVRRGFPWSKLLPYCLAQLAGAFVASAIVYATYYDALQAFDGGVRQVTGPLATAGIWATYPQPYLYAGDRWLGRPDRGHRAVVALHLCDLGQTQSGAGPLGCAGAGRCDRAGDWDHLRIQLRATRSIRPATWGPVCSLFWPDGVAMSSGRATAGGGSRSSVRSSAACWARGSTIC